MRLFKLYIVVYAVELILSFLFNKVLFATVVMSLLISLFNIFVAGSIDKC